MGRDDLKFNIVLHGEIEDDTRQWWDWYVYSKNLCSSLGFSPTHVAADWNNIQVGRYIKICSRVENNIKKDWGNGTLLEHIDILSVPDAYRQECLDYDLSFLRTKGKNDHYIHISLDYDIYKNLKDLEIEQMIINMKKHIVFRKGQTFQMLTTEFPYSYISRFHPPSYFKSLKILNEF